MRIVIIVSGGLDSTTLLYHALQEGHDARALIFDYGQRHHKEIDCARRTCQKLGVAYMIVQIPALGQISATSALTSETPIPEGHYEDSTMKATVVPNRNMILLAFAVAHALNVDAKEVWYGAHTGDHAIYPDCRPEFIRALNGAVRLCDWKQTRIRAPFQGMTKGQIVELGVTLGVDYAQTWSCYQGGERACGKCGSCVERLEAFEYAGIPDPLQYEKRLFITGDTSKDDR